MLSKMKDRRVLCALMLFLLFAVQMVMHMNVDSLLLDDWTFFEALSDRSMTRFLADRWNSWSSRLIIEGVLAMVTHSIWAFRLLDSLAMVLMAWSLCRLAHCEERPGMLALAGCLVTTIPFAVLRSTGWMATSLNYYWPLACTLTALIPLADALWGRKTARPLLLAAVACALFGANQEQTAAVIAGSSLVLGVWLYARERRVRPWLLVIFAIGAAELALHLLCPGNALRAEQSVTIVNLRDYGQFSFIDKLSIGLTSTTALLFFTWNPMLLACGALAAGSLAARRRGPLAYAPVLAVAALACLDCIAGKAGGGNALYSALQSYGTYVLQLGPQGIQAPGRFAVMFVIVALLGLMALIPYLSIGHRPLSAAAVFAFAVGFAARMALSFSPTVVESGERTMLPLYGAMMLCALLCARDCEREGARRWCMLLAGAVLAALALANALGSFALAA